MPALCLLAYLSEALVNTVFAYQFLMSTCLGDPSVIYYKYLVCVMDRSQSVSDSNDTLALGKFRDSVLDKLLVFRVNACRSFIKNDYRSIFEDRTAMEMRCFSPPESVPPPSPITVS